MFVQEISISLVKLLLYPIHVKKLKTTTTTTKQQQKKVKVYLSTVNIQV